VHSTQSTAKWHDKQEKNNIIDNIKVLLWKGMRDMTPMTAGLPSITQLGCPQRILAASNKKLPTTWQLRMA